jgi:hypothetical protein
LRLPLVAQQWYVYALIEKPRQAMEVNMGRGILLWLLGVPIPIIILLALVWR